MTSSTLKKPRVMDPFDCLGAILYSTLRNIMFQKVRGREFSYSFDVPRCTPYNIFPKFSLSTPRSISCFERKLKTKCHPKYIGNGYFEKKFTFIAFTAVSKVFSRQAMSSTIHAYN